MGIKAADSTAIPAVIPILDNTGTVVAAYEYRRRS